MRKSKSLSESLTPLLTATRVVPVERPRVKANTQASQTYSLAILNAIENARGFHPESNYVQHPTIGNDARKNYFDPNPVERWHPEFRDEILGKRKFVGESNANRATQILWQLEAARTSDQNGSGGGVDPATQKRKTRRNTRRDSEPDQEETPNGRGTPSDSDPQNGNGEKEAPVEEPQDDPQAPPSDPRRDLTTGGWLPPPGTKPPEEKPSDPRKDPNSQANVRATNLQGGNAKAVKTAQDSVTSRYSVEKDPFTQGPSYMSVFQKRRMQMNREQKPRQTSESINKYWG